MAKAMMFTKKKPADLVAMPDELDAEGAGSEDTPDAEDTVTCPNCKCEFNEATMKVEKPGLPVVDATDSLDESDSEWPTASNRGTAGDAAKGEQALTNALSDHKERVF